MAETFYTNFAQLRTSFFDTTIRFFRVSEVREVEDAGKTKVEPVVEEVARVQMSPQHAKALLLALSDNITKYESKHGEIRIPEIDAETGEIKQ